MKLVNSISRDLDRRVMIYRREVLGLSETFILAQARAMSKYRPHLFGPKPVDGLDLDGLPAYTLGHGRLSRVQELMFRYGGWGPSLMKAARERRFSLIHAHFAPDGAECLPLAERLRVPLIVTLHGWDVTITDDVLRQSRSGRKYLSLRRRLQEKASAFICVSRFIRDQALKKGFPAERLVVHYIGVDTGTLAPREHQQREPIVLFVGRLVEKKGLTHLLRAMASGHDVGTDVKLVVIGDGVLRKQHEKEARQLGVDCTFLGAQPNHVVHDWMRRAQVLAVPSVRAKSGDGEGLPITVYEAFALGLPVVGFASAGIPEAVSAATGLLAAEGNVPELAACIHLLARDSSLRGRLSAGARQCAVQNFDLTKQTAKLERFYDDVLNEKTEPGTGVPLSLASVR